VVTLGPTAPQVGAQPAAIEPKLAA
jgi:hypothetical protein